MKSLFTLTIVLLGFSASMGQNIRIPFEENFKDNTHNWPLYDSKALFSILQDSTFYIKGKSNASPNFFSKKFIADPEKDQIYELRITQKSGAKNMGYGLCWSATEDHRNWYTVLISSNRQYTILRKERGQYQEIKRWTKSKIVLGQGKENILTVIQRKKTLEYYINGTRVFTGKHEPTRGKEAGILFHGTMKLEVQGFSVKYEEEVETARGKE